MALVGKAYRPTFVVMAIVLLIVAALVGKSLIVISGRVAAANSLLGGKNGANFHHSRTRPKRDL